MNLRFDWEWTERDDFERPLKGYCDATVELDDGSRHRVAFYDPVRLAQEIEDMRRGGHFPLLAEANAIVLPRVTHEEMERAARELAAAGFFKKHLA